MSFLHLFGVPSAVPRFFACLLMLWVSQGQQAWAEGDIRTYPVPDGGYEAARDALIEVIEAEGLVVGAVFPFNQMLQRTGGKGGVSPFESAEIVQFCSSALAWELVLEAVEHLAVCPLSIAVYRKAASRDVMLAYRFPGDATLGRRKAVELLRRIAVRAVELARLRW